MKTQVPWCIIGVLCLLAVPAQAQTTFPLIDYQGFSYETGGFTPSQPGDVLNILGVVDNVDPSFGVDLGTEELTLLITGLGSLGETDLGAGFISIAYTGGTLELWRDAGVNRDYGINPPNATAPATFIDGSLLLSGTLSGFTLFYDTNTGSGAFEGNVEFTGGSALTTVECIDAEGFTIGGVLDDDASGGGVLEGYDLQVDGLIEFRAVTADDFELIAINDVQQSEGVDELVRIPDATTGVGQLVGSLGTPFINTETLAVLLPCGGGNVAHPDAVDRIFAIDDARLIELDPDTGDGTEIGPLGFSDVDGMAFHPLTGVLYGITYATNKLLTIDIATGAATLVAEDVVASRKINELAFHPDGRAFVVTDGTPRVYEIDIETGAKLHKWVLQGASSLESLLWTLDGTTLYSAADRDGSKDLVTIELHADSTGTISFVSPLSSQFTDIEELAWLNKNLATHLFRARTPATDVATFVVPSRARLQQNVPNPFNPATRIRFTLARAEDVELLVYDVRGRRVITLLQGPLEAGAHEVTWNGVSVHGRPVSAGLYEYTLSGRDWRESRRMVLVR